MSWQLDYLKEDFFSAYVFSSGFRHTHIVKNPWLFQELAEVAVFGHWGLNLFHLIVLWSFWFIEVLFSYHSEYYRLGFLQIYR